MCNRPPAARPCLRRLRLHLRSCGRRRRRNSPDRPATHLRRRFARRGRAAAAGESCAVCMLSRPQAELCTPLSRRNGAPLCCAASSHMNMFPFLRGTRETRCNIRHATLMNMHHAHAHAPWDMHLKPCRRASPRGTERPSPSHRTASRPSSTCGSSSRRVQSAASSLRPAAAASASCSG